MAFRAFGQERGLFGLLFGLDGKLVLSAIALHETALVPPLAFRHGTDGGGLEEFQLVFGVRPALGTVHAHGFGQFHNNQTSFDDSIRVYWKGFQKKALKGF